MSVAISSSSIVVPNNPFTTLPAAHAEYQSPTDSLIIYGIKLDGADGEKWTKEKPRLFTVDQAVQLHSINKPMVYGWIQNDHTGTIGNRDVFKYEGMILKTTPPDGTNIIGPNLAFQTKDKQGKLVNPQSLYPLQTRGGDIMLATNPGKYAARLDVGNYTASTYYEITGYRPRYVATALKPGQTVRIPVLNTGWGDDEYKEMPEGTSFLLHNNWNNYGGWDVKVSQLTGEITVTLDENSTDGIDLFIPIEVSYPRGGGSEIIYSHVTNLHKPDTARVDRVEKTDDGSYQLVRSDGTIVTGKIETSGGGVTNVKPGPDGSLILVNKDGSESEPIQLDHVTIKETGKGTPKHTITITSPNGQTVTFNAFDYHLTDIKINNGKYDLYRSDNPKEVWKTIDPTLNSITGIRPDGKGNIITTINGNDVTVNLNKVTVTERDKGKPSHTITLNIPGQDPVTFSGFDNHLTDVKFNKGVYELYRADNPGKVWKTIDPTKGSVTDIKPDGKGNITITINGKPTTVNLDKITVTENNKGAPNHTITLNIPGHGPVTFDAFDNYLTDVKFNNGKYDLYRADNPGKVWRTIDPAQGSITDIKPDGKGNLIITINGKETVIPLDKVTAVEKDKGKPTHTITLNIPGQGPVTFNAFDNYLTDVKFNNGKYDLYRADNPKIVWRTIDPTKGSITDIRPDGKGNITVLVDGKRTTVKLDKVTVSEDGKDTSNHTITLNIPGHGPVTFDAFDQHLAEVKDNGKGVYTLILNDGSPVRGLIDTSGGVKGITSNPDGSITVHYIGKNPVTVQPERVKITEANKGTPNHTVTIAVPGGDTVTFKAFDTYVTEIKWNDKAKVYEIYRNDVDGGKKIWRTISLKSLHDRVKALEDKNSPSRDEFNKVLGDISNINTTLTNMGDVRGDLTLLQNEVGELTWRVYALEPRIDTLEKKQIKAVIQNKDGSYSLLRVDNTRVEMDIDPTTNSVTNVVTNKDGSITFHFGGNKKPQTVTPEKIAVTEKGKNTPQHTITISIPGEKPFTFKAHNTYVSEIKWNNNAKVYEIYRNDVGGGKQVWRTIDLASINARLDAIEAKNSPDRAEFDALKHLVKEHSTFIEQFTNEFGDTKQLRNELANINDRLDRIDVQIAGILAELDKLHQQSIIRAERHHDNSVTLTKKGGEQLTIPAASKFGLEKCVGQLGGGLMALIPLIAMLSQIGQQVHIPGLAEQQVTIQKQLGVYNENVAQFMQKNGGALAAGAIGIGALTLAFLPGTCNDTSIAGALRESLQGNTNAANPQVRETYELDKFGRFVPKRVAEEAEEAANATTH